MKLLNILHTESSDGWGGQEIRIFLEAQAMKKLGHNVIIFCQPTSGIMEKSNKVGIIVENSNMNRKGTVRAIRDCRKIIDENQIDILITHSSRDSWIGSIAGRISKKKPFIIRTRHLSIPIQTDLISRFFYHNLQDGVITTGEVIRKEIIKKYKLSSDHVISIPTGVDINRFNYEFVQGALRDSLGIGEERIIVGTVSVLRSWKGHLDLIEAAQKVIHKFPSVVFVIVGEGPMKFLIKGEIDKLRLQGYFFFLGFREDVPQIMASFDLFVHPSFANEGVPQALLQAMAMGKAVVACDVGGIPEVVQNGINGLLVPPKDPHLLSEAIIKLLEDNKTLELMGEEGRKEVLRNWSIEIMIEKTLKFYGDILKRNHHST